MMDGKLRISSVQRIVYLLFFPKQRKPALLFRISRRPKSAMVRELRVITCRKPWLEVPRKAGSAGRGLPHGRHLDHHS